MSSHLQRGGRSARIRHIGMIHRGVSRSPCDLMILAGTPMTVEFGNRLTTTELAPFSRVADGDAAESGR